jgi:hypothetical protein
VFVFYAFVLYFLEVGDLSPKHVGEFMCMDDLWFYVNCVPSWCILVIRPSLSGLFSLRDTTAFLVRRNTVKVGLSGTCGY